ncbi:MAG: hypothetical protein ACE5J5_03285 [Candidatus Hydrothermarchaeales archaeon]
MVKEDTWENKKIYRCGECNLGYLDKEIAQKCENFCKTHNACSMEITKNAVVI